MTTDTERPKFDNDDVAQDLREHQQEKVDAERADLEDALTVKERIQRNRRADTFDVDVYSEPVEFSMPTGAQSTRMMEISTEWAELVEGFASADLSDDPDDLEDLREQSSGLGDTVREFSEDIAEILADCSVPDDLDAAFWADTFTIAELIAFARQVNAGGEDPLEADEIEGFREE